MLVRLLGLGLIAGVITASPAMAQSDRDDRARLHFESGRSYFEEGAYERALQEFETAYELSPRTAMLFNLGTTYERLGRLSEAADAFEDDLGSLRSLTLATDIAWIGSAVVGAVGYDREEDRILVYGGLNGRDEITDDLWELVLRE